MTIKTIAIISQSNFIVSKYLGWGKLKEKSILQPHFFSMTIIMLTKFC